MLNLFFSCSSCVVGYFSIDFRCIGCAVTMSTRVAFSALMVTIIMGVAAYCWLLITGRRAVFDNLEVSFSNLSY